MTFDYLVIANKVYTTTGHYIPQLADLIFANSNSTPMMNLKGIMVSMYA